MRFRVAPRPVLPGRRRSGCAWVCACGVAWGCGCGCSREERVPARRHWAGEAAPLQARQRRDGYRALATRRSPSLRCPTLARARETREHERRRGVGGVGLGGRAVGADCVVKLLLPLLLGWVEVAEGALVHRAAARQLARGLGARTSLLPLVRAREDLVFEGSDFDEQRLGARQVHATRIGNVTAQPRPARGTARAARARSLAGAVWRGAVWARGALRRKVRVTRSLGRRGVV